MANLFKELRRRNIFRVAGVYAVVGWLLVQMAVAFETALSLPAWFDAAITATLLIGFPVALILAWAFEMTPEGVKLTAAVPEGTSIAAKTGRKLDYFIIGGLALVGVLIIADRVMPENPAQVENDDGDNARLANATSGQIIDRSKSIAVLPFADFSPANDQEWFSDGLAEEILNALVRTPDLLVASRTSSFKYRGTDEEIQVIAKRLGVEHVLEGSVRRAGDRLRVTAQLIRASDGFHLWSQNYDRASDDVIAIQEDIAVEIAKALKTAMDPEALAEMVSAGTRSIEAYEAYLESLALQQASSFGDVTPMIKAYEALERARTIDPTFAEAHFEAGQFWSSSFIITNSTPPMGVSAEAALQNALERIDLAIANETDDAQRTYYESGKLFALSEFRAAAGKLRAYLEQFPNDARALNALALNYVFLGEYEKANEINRKNESVGGDDIDQLTSLIIGYLWARDYDAAARISRLAIRSAPNNVGAMYQAHRALLWAGATEEANALMPNYQRMEAGTAGALMVEIRDACANGDRPRAERAATLTPTIGDSDAGLQWITFHLLGETQQAKQLIVHLDRAAPPYQIMGFLYYPYFDASKFPNISRVLEREGVTRPPPVKIPFACPPADENAIDENSIAVLPFVALSNDDSDAYFGKGIAEELLNALAQFPDLKVAARTSAFSFEGQNTDLRDVGEKLGVAHVLEGSVRRAGDTVRITAQLIRVADGFHIWSETYERELTDVFAIQDEIVHEISRNLQVRLGIGGGTGRASGEGVDPQAYEQYLRGLTLWGERDRAPGNRRAAITALQRSTQFDPEFAGAWSALGLFGAFSGAAALGLDPDEFAKTTKEALERAIALDPNNATANAGLVAWHATRELNVELAQHYLERALSLAPNKAESHYVAAMFWSVTGDAEESIAAYERAIALDPLNLTMQRVYAEFLLITGRSEDAFTFFDACMENRCLVAGIELFALAAAVVAGDETRIANWSPAALNSLGPNAAPPSFPFLFRAFVSIASDQSDAATFEEALGKIPPGALPNELQGIWAPVLADYVQKDSLFTSQKNGLRHGGLLGSPYAMAPYYGANPYPEWVLRDPRYHAIWARPGMAELADARRANGQTAGLPLPIEGEE